MGNVYEVDDTGKETIDGGLIVSSKLGVDQTALAVTQNNPVSAILTAKDSIGGVRLSLDQSNLIVNGKIGVDTPAPQENLHVAGNIKASGVLPSIILQDSLNTPSGIQAVNDYFQINTGGTGTVWVLANGHVGIGISGPTLMLEVAGDMRASGNLTLGNGNFGDKFITVYNTDANKPFIKYDDTLNQWQFSNNGLTIFPIGGGNGQPQGLDRQLQFNDGGLFNGTTGIYYSTSNKLGIGTSGPVYDLDVVGTVRATHFIGDGSQLTNPPSDPNKADLTYVNSQLSGKADISYVNSQDNLLVSKTVSSTISAQLTYTFGSFANGKVLTSDSFGNVSWQNASGSGDAFLGSDQIFTGYDTFEKGVILGDGSTGIAIFSSSGVSGIQPAIAFDPVNGHWIFSNDGINYNNVGAGGGGDVFLNENNEFTGLNVFDNLLTVGQPGLTADLVVNGFIDAQAYFLNGVTFSGGTGSSNGVTGISAGFGITIDQGTGLVTISSSGDSVWGITVNDIYSELTGHVGIGTRTPAYKLDVNGSINASQIFIEGVPFGGGTASQWVGSTGAIFFNGGNVGIGITAPISSLDVAGAGRFTSYMQSYIGSVDTRIYNTGLIAEDAIATRVQLLSNADSYIAVPGQNVGIGTQTPARKLHVSGDMRIDLAGLQVFAVNADAVTGGLTAGDLYRTGGDPDLIAVVH